MRLRGHCLQLRQHHKRHGGQQHHRADMAASQLSRPAECREDPLVFDLHDRPDYGKQGQHRKTRHDQQHQPGDHRRRYEHVGGDEPPPRQRPCHLQHGERRPAVLGRADKSAGEARQQHRAQQTDAGRAERRTDRQRRISGIDIVVGQDLQTRAHQRHRDRHREDLPPEAPQRPRPGGDDLAGAHHEYALVVAPVTRCDTAAPLTISGTLRHRSIAVSGATTGCHGAKRGVGVVDVIAAAAAG
jgi:hypothetical protein